MTISVSGILNKITALVGHSSWRSRRGEAAIVKKLKRLIYLPFVQ
ncbi:hypothetical protein [Nostoc sp.]